MNDLDFITDVSLHKTIENSIEHTYVLFEETKEESKSVLYKEETYRVIVLYTVAIIEAILLHLYKKCGEEITHLDYKYIKNLSPEYQNKNHPESSVVIAVQKSVKKAEHQIGMVELVKFFEEKKFMKKDTAVKLTEFNNLRNTFHLSKPRGEVLCGVAQVESALNMLVYVIKNAPKSVPRII